jgi:hypothetical protein
MLDASMFSLKVAVVFAPTATVAAALAGETEVTDGGVVSEGGAPPDVVKTTSTQ